MTNLFATAKKIETKTSASAKPKDRITVEGIEADLIRYEKIKRDEANLKSEKEMIGGRIKGTIDRLCQFNNPEELFSLIEPTVALK